MAAFRSAIVISATLAAMPYAHAQDKYQVTDTERAACQGDAIRLCSSAYPDQDSLLTCMKTNQAKLTTVCRPVFLAGLHRRGIQ